MRFWRVAPGLLAALTLGACSDDPHAVRPGDQPLERLANVSGADVAELPDMSGAATASACAEILRVSEQGGLIAPRTDPRRLVVDENLWEQVPPNVRRHIVRCAEGARPPDARSAPIPVIDSSGNPAAR